MEIYILSKQDLSILSICKVSDYEINLDEETNAKSIFKVIKTEGLKKGNFLVVNGLYRQFLFLIDDVETEKGSEVSTITALDISNIFDRKVIEKNTNTMTESSIEQFIANTISANFVNSDDSFLNVGYIDIYWHTNTQGIVVTNSEDGLYNFHTFLINCRQYKNIYTEFQFVNGRLRIDIRNKEESTRLIDATLPEVTDYNKVYDNDITAKVTVLIRENGSEYNLYLKTDRTTTENKNDPNRAEGKIDVISVDTADVAKSEALNVMKGNTYKHLVEFKIAKSSKLMDIAQLYIGRNIRIRTDDDIYDSYISAITIKDENFVYFKSGNLRTTLLDKLKQGISTSGNKLDVSGGVIKGNLKANGNLSIEGVAEKLLQNHGRAPSDLNDAKTYGTYHLGEIYTNAPTTEILYGVLIVYHNRGTTWNPDGSNWIWQEIRTTSGNIYVRNAVNTTNSWREWKKISIDEMHTVTALNLDMSLFDTVDNNKVVKTGHVVTVYFRAHTSSDISNGTNFATLPYTSIVNSVFPVYSGGRYSLTDPIFSHLESNTKNWIIAPVATDKWLQASFTYITSD